ncbi:uncharacterized protein BCR38DRAFT_340562 [Pseudomassariella vexata]|uniref:F-box domain-containing protein n=1 Tax=Pseudomassariella vexata TaxID=1141098 RepID=A0A1Y2E4G5_9PEZI|nr:uncharacterized protein BCR38DRAFT_340562 [Pseudomassariella vexata]ORY66450.1 hypothetical protein BCR38DRAFT_340562 [Pseudomassariella vexata]
MEPVVESPSKQPVPSLSRLLKGKEREWMAVRSKMGPLHLLDLPVDILRLIVKEITHTNDLTSLALTNSTLYNLSVPHIYARFDIVWPDSTMTASDSKSVDALTYGLSTLCLGSKFAQRTRWLKGGTVDYSALPSQRLVDNQYAKYTRKFSLGNGPTDWVAEYNITKESGKMLGTLVALAVAKMLNLETFVWDMPTGVLSDVFMALASLQDHYADGEPKLEKVWIRWHDNSDTGGTVSSAASSPAVHPAIPAVPPINHLNPIVIPPAIHSHAALAPPPKYSDSQVEFPTFSVLPPLKSLTVLDVDELAYLDEMSVLIERSKKTLQELRVGVSQKAHAQDFVRILEGDNLQQVDLSARWPGESRIGYKRLGGVLGVLVGRVYEIRQKGRSRSKRRESGSNWTPNQVGSFPNDTTYNSQPSANGATYTNGSASENAHAEINGFPKSQGNSASSSASGGLASGSRYSQNGKMLHSSYNGRKRLEGKLRLHTLELERIALSMPVCCRAFDWSVLTNLTILECVHHESLWKILKRHFQPTPPPCGSAPGTPVQYHMALKKIHTDATTHSLISFIKETLAPNTLEVLFLQDRRRSPPPLVTIEQIFKGALKRHRSSLKKLLIDSNDKLERAAATEETRWQHWVLTSNMVAYLTSGRFGNLKELAVAVHYRDWHPFLQRLPNIPQLRSLFIPHIQDHIVGTFEPKELALQLVDIITLRPEIQLCYVGIGTKCFEILEARPSDVTGGGSDQFGLNGHHHHNTGAISVIDVDDEDDDGENDHSDADEETEDDDAGTNGSPATDAEDDFNEVSDDAESEPDSFLEPENSQSSPKLRLREILFYDDKVAIFKARHGKL